VAERLVEFGNFLAAQPESIHPVVREILCGGHNYTAVDAFAAPQRLQELKAVVGRLWQQMDAVVVPTIGTTFTVDEVLARPIDCNTMLGHYTHFGNLLDLLGVAVPLGTTAGGRPYSAMLLGAALSDDTVLALAARILDEPREPSRPDVTASAAFAITAEEKM
jgi:allophanate hydrolase